MKNTIVDMKSEMEGIMRCSRYSFGPNRLHYCGPDLNSELRDYIKENKTDPGLEIILRKFGTLYPYLCHVAKTNNIKDPFDPKVVEAYWLGNELLESGEKRQLHKFFVDDLKIKDKFSSKEFEWLENKIKMGAVPHHSFHVLNIWKQEGHNDSLDDLNRIGQCLISYGTVEDVKGPEIIISTEPLIYMNGKFSLGTAISKTLFRSLEAEYDIEQIKIGEIVSFHWGVPCEVITKKQAEMLKKYTLKNIDFANLTL